MRSPGAFTRCPHCGHEYPNNTLERHSVVCLGRPAVFATTRAALDAGDGRIKTILAYSETRGSAPAANTLYDQVGSSKWRNVAKFFELRFSMERLTAIVAAEFAEVETAGDDDLDTTMATLAATIRQRWDDEDLAWRGGGFPVCRVTPDGGNRVRCMLR